MKADIGGLKGKKIKWYHGPATIVGAFQKTEYSMMQGHRTSQDLHLIVIDHEGYIRTGKADGGWKVLEGGV